MIGHGNMVATLSKSRSEDSASAAEQSVVRDAPGEERRSQARYIEAVRGGLRLSEVRQR